MMPATTVEEWCFSAAKDRKSMGFSPGAFIGDEILLDVGKSADSSPGLKPN